jgi:hypothetical protein
LGIDSGSGIGDCDSGYSCAYARNISWASATEPLPKLTSPALVFDQLFGGFDPEATAEQQARRRARRESVLDYVREDAKRLQGKLGENCAAWPVAASGSPAVRRPSSWKDCVRPLFARPF